MKKLLLLFAVLLSTVSGWAEVQPGRRTLDLQEGKTYFISAATSYRGVYTNLLQVNDKNQLVFSNHKPTDVISDEDKSVYLFTVEKINNDGTYYLKNDAAGKYLLSGSPTLAAAQTAIKIVPYGKDGIKGTYTCGNDVDACDALGNIITYNNITEDIPIVCVYEQYIEGETTKDRGWRGIGSFDIGKTTPFAFYEVNDDLFEVTYKFVDTEKNILHTETFTASEGSALLNAHNFLKVPSNVVTLTNAPTGEANPATPEYTIIVSYNDNFPFVPTTIVDGNFVQGTKWYNMKVRHGNDIKRLKAVGDDLKEDPSWNDYRDMNQYFAFTGDPLNGFYLHNKNLGGSKVFSCVVNESTTRDEDGKFSTDNGVAMELFSRNGYWQFAPIVRPIANARIHDLNGSLGYWHSSGANGDSGSDFTIFCVDVEAGIKTANFQFKENGVVRYEESVTAYPGYDITLNPPYGISHNIEKMPKEGGNIEVPWTYTGTFEYYPSFNEIKKWYYLKLNSKYVYHQDGESYLTLYGNAPDLEEHEAHAWAFVGNPWDGYRIYNRTTGSTKILSSSTTASGSAGGNTHPIMTDIPVPTGNNEFWYATASPDATDGFYLEQKGHSSHKMNDRGDVYTDENKQFKHCLSFWTDGAGAGSTFVTEEAIPVKLTTDDSNPIYYALKTGRTFNVNQIPAEWWYNYTNTGGQISLTQFDGTDAQWWYFKGKLVDNKVCVQLVPKSDNTKCMSYANSNDEADKIIAQPDGTTGYTNTWRFAFKGGRYVLQTSDGRSYLSQNGGENKKMGLWSGSPESDGGTALYIYEIKPFMLEDEAGNQYGGEYLYQLESLANPTFTGSHALALSNIQRGETFTADVDFGFPVSKLDGTADISVLISGWRGTKDECYFKYYVDASSNVKVTSVSPTSTNVRNFEWSIYPHLAGSDFTFTIKNIGTGKYIQTNAKVEATAAGTVTVGDEASATSFIWEANNRFKIVDENLRLSVTSSSTEDQNLGVDEGHNGCNTFITNTIDYVNNWKTQNIAVFGYVGAYPATLQNEINAVESYSDIPTFESEHAEYIIPITEGYYYIKSVDLSKFAVNDNNGFRATTDPASEKSANNIFRLVSNGDGKYKFQSFANGKYVTLRDADTKPTSSPSEIDEIFANGSSFSFEGSDFAQFKIKDENDNVMRHEGGEKSYAINYWSSDVKYWYLIQAPELPLTIHRTGYSTFSAAVDVEVPDGVNAYYAKSYDADKVRMSPIQQIPANQGVVIKGTGSETVKFPIISNAEALPADNLLKAHLNTEAVTPEDGSVFIMATKNDVTGFYPLSTTNNVIGGHKSYLEIPATSAARLSIVWDDTETGIHEAEGGEQNVEIYDLTGRRLDKPAKGVNIIGGKLVIK